MAQFQTPETFANGELVTGNRLNNIIGQATALSGLITEQTALATDVSATDSILIHSASGLRKTTLENLFDAKNININALSVVTNNITSKEGDVLTIKPLQSAIGAWGDVVLGDLLSGNHILLRTQSVTTGSGNISQIDVTTQKLYVQSPKVDLQSVVKFDTTKHVLLPSGNTSQRPQPVLGDTMVQGMFRYNSETKRLEFYDGTAWRSSQTEQDQLYKTFTKQVTGAPGVTDWTVAESTWQWRTSANIDIPIGEVWEYTVLVEGGSTGWGNTRPEYNHHARLYIGDTIARDVQCRISVYAGQWNALLKINVTKADVTPAKKVGLKFVKGSGVGGAGIRAEGLQIIVSVTKRKVSDDTEIGQIL